MKKIKVYISHNKFGYANPSAISPLSNRVIFDMEKVSENLKSKVFGQIGFVELTTNEMKEILDANTGIRRVGATMMKNLGF